MAQTGALFAETPDGTLIELTPANGGDHFVEVNNGVDTPDDTDLLSSTANNTLVDFLNFQDVPGDFDVAIDVVGRMRTELSGVVDDTVSLTFSVYASNETTPLEALTSLTGNHGLTDTTGSAQANTDDAAAWNSYKMQLQVLRSNSGMPDSIQADFSEVELDIQYDVASAADTEWAGTQVQGGLPVRRRPEMVAY